MGNFCARMKAAAFPNEADLSVKDRPPPLLGVLFCLISTFCVICSMVAFHWGATTIILCLALVVLNAAVATREGSAWERNYPSTFFFIPIGIGTAVIPLLIGIQIYVKVYVPYYLAVNGRHYTEVSASAKSAEYADAGIIQFNAGAALDASRSFGFQGDDFTYCVAPVVDQAHVHPQSQGPKISFWAVGQDCCGNRRNFECDGAGETEVRNAFSVGIMDQDRLTKMLLPETSRPMYLKAVKAAQAMHNLRAEDENNIILVRWASDPETILEVWHRRAVLSVVLACILYAIVITFVWTSIHLYFDREVKTRSGYGKAHQNYGLNTGQPNTGTVQPNTGQPNRFRPVKDPFMLGP